MQSYFLSFDFCVRKTHKKATRRSRRSRRSKRSFRGYTKLAMTTSNYMVSSQAPIPTERKLEVRKNKIVEGAVVKDKIGELEEEVRAGNSRRIKKELTGVVQCVLGRRRFLVRFQNGCENNLSSNQLTVVIVEKMQVEEEPEVATILEIPEDQVEKEKG